jgi:hypothetical protein
MSDAVQFIRSGNGLRLAYALVGTWAGSPPRRRGWPEVAIWEAWGQPSRAITPVKRRSRHQSGGQTRFGLLFAGEYGVLPFAAAWIGPQRIRGVTPPAPLAVPIDLEQDGT